MPAGRAGAPAAGARAMARRARGRERHRQRAREQQPRGRTGGGSGRSAGRRGQGAGRPDRGQRRDQRRGRRHEARERRGHRLLRAREARQRVHVGEPYQDEAEGGEQGEPLARVSRRQPAHHRDRERHAEPDRNRPQPGEQERDQHRPPTARAVARDVGEQRRQQQDDHHRGGARHRVDELEPEPLASAQRRAPQQLEVGVEQQHADRLLEIEHQQPEEPRGQREAEQDARLVGRGAVRVHPGEQRAHPPEQERPQPGREHRTQQRVPGAAAARAPEQRIAQQPQAPAQHSGDVHRPAGSRVRARNTSSSEALERSPRSSASVPEARRRPRSMMVTRSQRRSATSSR